MRAALPSVLLVAATLAPLGAGDVAHGPPADFLVYVAPPELGEFAGEPSIGANPRTGNVLFQSYTQTLRVVFDDAASPPTAAWTPVEPLQTSIMNNDPILLTDRATGRTWAGGLNGQCSILAMTDDDGATWVPAGNACASPSFDHQTLASGPWREPRPAGATHERAFYYCAQTFAQQCASSMDGGLTFTPGVLVNPSLRCTGLTGHAKVAEDGYVYLPSRVCVGGAGLSVSGDNGLTWTQRVVPGSQRALTGFDPSVATTPSGWVYFAYEGADQRPMVALSRDHGASWTAPVAITAGTSIQSATFLAAVAGDDTRVAVAYLATRDAGNAFAPTFAGAWDLYVSTSLDAGATWTTTQVTTDPVQRGWICASGTACPVGTDGSQPGRNLLDFIDATLDPSGRVLVAFADGCIAACASDPTAGSDASKASIARQAGGPCLVSLGCLGMQGSPVPPRFDDQCGSRVVIFSSHSATGRSVNPHAAACSAAALNPGVSTTLVNPGSDQISLRFIQDLGPDVPRLSARVWGLGVDRDVELVREEMPTGGFAYNSARVPIDPSARGDITAMVQRHGVELDRVTFSTA